MNEIEEIKSRLDIVDVISKYIDLRPAGSNFKALSPFQQEKTPSFMVSPSLQIFKDFSSGKGGDLISFIQEFERLSFREALEKAAEMAGVKLKGSVKDERLEQKKAEALKAHELATKYYEYILKTHPQGKVGRDYAQKRGIESKELHNFRFGYAPNSRNNLVNFLSKKGFKKKAILEYGLAVERNGEILDKFANRLLQPLFNTKGEVIGFSGRYLGNYENAPKYLNSPKTILYNKDQELYSLFHAQQMIRNTKKVIVVEGNLDVISSYKVGIQNIVAPLGTSLTEKQVKILKRYADEVILCFDSDKAGESAILRAVEIFERLKVQHKVIGLGEYQDSDELIQNDPKLWNKKVENPEETFDYLINKWSNELDLGSVQGKRSFQSKVYPMLNLIKDLVVQDHYIKEVALKLDVSSDLIKGEISSSGKLLRITRYEDEEENKEDSPKSSRELKLETYFIAALTKVDKAVRDQYSDEFISEKPYGEVFNLLIQSDWEINEEILQELDEEIKEIVQEIALIDVESLTDNIENFLADKHKRLKDKYLRNRIMVLRKKLSEDVDSESLNELQSLTKELGGLMKKE